MKILGHEWSNILWKFGWKRRLRHEPTRAGDSIRSKVINFLLEPFEESAYLEIGLYFGFTFERIVAVRKLGVDPKPRFRVSKLPEAVEVIAESSDLFFEQLDSKISFNVAFVDGLHESQQCRRDVLNAISRVSEGGFVVVDDVWPSDKFSSLPDQRLAFQKRKSEIGVRSRQWHGDVFRVIMWLMEECPSIPLVIVGEPGEAVAVVEVTRLTLDRFVRTEYFENSLPMHWTYSDFLSWIESSQAPPLLSWDEFQSLHRG